MFTNNQLLVGPNHEDIFPDNGLSFLISHFFHCQNRYSIEEIIKKSFYSSCSLKKGVKNISLYSQPSSLSRALMSSRSINFIGVASSECFIHAWWWLVARLKSFSSVMRPCDEVITLWSVVQDNPLF